MSLGDRVRLEIGALVISQGGDIVIGDQVYVGPYSVLYGTGGLTVGRNTMIAAHVVMPSHNHVFADRERPIREQGVTTRGIVIGEDVWVGANAVILDGAVVGDGAVVAAGAVVRGEVAPFTVVAGVPAKVVSQRGRAISTRQPAG